MVQKNFITQTKSNHTVVRASIYLFLSIVIALTTFSPAVEAQTKQTNNTSALPMINDNTELSKLLFERERARFNQAETQSKNVGELNQAIKDTMIGRNNALRGMFINPKVNLDNQGRATRIRIDFFEEYKKTIRENKDLTSQGLMHQRTDFIKNRNKK